MLRRKVKFAQDVAGLTKQADTFLKNNGFPATPEYRKLFGAFIQHLPETQDWFDPSRVAAMMRKARANEAAFWVMNPERWEAEKKKAKEASDAETTKSATSKVV